MTLFITRIISAFLLPPLNLLVPLLLIAHYFLRYPKKARVSLKLVIAVLWLFSTPYYAQSMLQILESQTHALTLPLPKADAIVILGAGSYFYPPEYTGQATVSEETLVRLRYGAKLYRDTHCPVLVTGGKPLGNNLSEAEQMQSVLAQEFQVPVRWIENNSNNTLENARYSFKQLEKAGIKRIYLVTHAKHIFRAAIVFKHAGFEVIDAPTAFTTRYNTDLLTFIPSALALQNSSEFLHELIGVLWYYLNK